MRHVAWLLALAAFACGDEGDADCVDRKTAEPEHLHDDGKGTYAGESCIESGCHLASALGISAPPYHAAGTIYKSDGVTPAVGVTVRFSPLASTATETSVVTDEAGNFFVLSSAPTPFPSIPEVTACPDVSRMLEGAVDPSYGSCAVQGCHSLGAGRGPVILED